MLLDCCHFVEKELMFHCSTVKMLDYCSLVLPFLALKDTGIFAGLPTWQDGPSASFGQKWHHQSPSGGSQATEPYRKLKEFLGILKNSRRMSCTHCCGLCFVQFRVSAMSWSLRNFGKWTVSVSDVVFGWSPSRKYSRTKCLNWLQLLQRSLSDADPKMHSIEFLSFPLWRLTTEPMVCTVHFPSPRTTNFARQWLNKTQFIKSISYHTTRSWHTALLEAEACQMKSNCCTADL